MRRFTEIILKNRIIALILLAVLSVAGIVGYLRLPTDAFPDLSPVMVPVFSEAHGMAPEEVERLITFPIESAMNGLPGVTQVKSTSAFGMAVVYVYFRDGVDIYFARQIVAERLTVAMAEMPDLEEPPVLGPISSGLSEVFMYYLTADSTADTEGKELNTWLREINDWIVKYRLQSVPGVTEILSMGGHVLQYQIKLDPYAMRKHGVLLETVVEAVSRNNGNAGGQFLVLGSEEYLVRGLGLIEKKEHLGDIQVKVVEGSPVRVRDIAQVEFGNEVRRGVVTLNGREEVVAGIVIKLLGENTSSVIERLDRKVAEVQASLPRGVALIPYYNQSVLVENAVGTVKDALWQGALLVVMVLVLFLGNLRSAFTVALSLPICVFTASLFMGWTGLSANLMSLGGIAVAIGMLCDASIVIVENMARHLGEKTNRNTGRLELLSAAAGEVGRPILFSMTIIILVFLPLFTLEGVEGKMFRPMAFTICFALAGSVLAGLLFSPVLAYFLMKPSLRHSDRVMDYLKKVFRPMVEKALLHRKRVLIATVSVFICALALIPLLGTEFIPTLEEGNLQINVVMAPSISLEKGTETVMKMEKLILSFREVDQTIGKIGRPEAGSHPHPVNSAHIQIMLKKRGQWPDYRTKPELIQAMNKRLKDFPGVQISFTQPIQNMFDELLSGVKTQLAVKVFGDDLTVLRDKAGEIQAAITGIPGLADLASEQSFGQPQVQIAADRDACARYGVDIADILELVELGIGGEKVGSVYVNARRFGILIRFQEAYRADEKAVGNLLVKTSGGYSIPLSMVAGISRVTGPIQINREKNQRRWTLSANVRGRDLGGVVADIRERVKEKIRLPPGYYLEYGGQFENQQRAMKRLALIVPVTFVMIFIMLFLSLKSLRSALLIFLNVPLALIGGVFGLFAFGEYLSVPASVGFIALFGIAVQNGLILVTYINTLREEGMTVRDAVIHGSVRRLRPVLMTALCTMLGLIPLLLSTGMGSEVQRPLAVVVVCGLLSSTFLTLFFIPALYEWFAQKLSREK